MVSFKLWLTEKEQSSLFPDIDVSSEPEAISPKVDAEKYRGIVCPKGAFGEHQPAIGKFARQSPENMAQVAMFSPMSARTLFMNMQDHFPVIIHLLRYFHKNNHVSPAELEQQLKDYFSKSGANTRSVVFGWKLKTITDLWNNRKSYYNKAMSLYSDKNWAGLLELFSGIAGLAPVKAGFVVQLIFGELGCIDSHNVRIYQKASQELGWGGSGGPSAEELEPSRWDKGASDKTTKRNIEAYLDVLNKLQSKGIDSAALWNVWVDWMAAIYREAENIKSTAPALNPELDPYKQFQGLTAKTNVSAAASGGRKGKSVRDKSVISPIASGAEGGHEMSGRHLTAAMTPDEMLDASRIKKKYSNYGMGNWREMSPEDIAKLLRSTKTQYALPFGVT